MTAATYIRTGATMVETRFLVTGEVFQCDNGSTYRVTKDAFTLLGTTLRPVEVTDQWGRKHDENITVESGVSVLVIGRHC